MPWTSRLNPLGWRSPEASPLPLPAALLACLCLNLVVITDCAAGPPPTADLVLTQGAIYTVDDTNPWAEALAVRDGAIVFVGSNAGVQAFIGSQTQVIDLEGLMVIPGLHDSHMHVLEAHQPASGTCYLPPGQGLNSHIARIQACAPSQVGTDWVMGYGHSILDLLEHIDFGGAPPVQILDIAVPDRPAVFMEETSHSVWVNSLALEAAGFDATTPDPVGGAILRSPNGQPNGILLDAAGEIVLDLALAPNPELDALNDQALIDGLDLARRHGITSLVDARGHWRRGYVEAYERARDAGRLTARVVVSLWAYPYLDDASQIAQLTTLYDNDPTSRLRLSQIKIYSDGEIGHTTAALLEPYTCCDLVGPLGLNYFDEARLTHYVTQLEAVGFDFHIHAIGDRGVHEALNAVAAARRAQGASNQGNPSPRHRLTHVELVAPQDVPRFAALDVTADMQMSHMYVEPPFLHLNDDLLGHGRIEERIWRLRTLHDAGARVVLSSDYDVGEISPFAGMQRALNRGAESLPDVATAIRAYTLNAAYLMRQEDRVGSLEVGKRADLVVLDRNLFDIPSTQLGQVQVLRTFVDGEQVWGEGLDEPFFQDGFEIGSTLGWSDAVP